MNPELVKALADAGAVVWLGIISWQIVRWRRREGKAKKNGNGKNRRLTDGNPGNPHSWFDHIEQNCVRHETDFKEIRNLIDKNKTELQGEMRGIRDRVIGLEVQHKSRHPDTPKG